MSNPPGMATTTPSNGRVVSKAVAPIHRTSEVEVDEDKVLLAEYRRRYNELAQSVSDSVRIIKDLSQQKVELKKLLKAKGIAIPSELE
jgi:hypothetical protein